MTKDWWVDILVYNNASLVFISAFVTVVALSNPLSISLVAWKVCSGLLIAAVVARTRKHKMISFRVANVFSSCNPFAFW